MEGEGGREEERRTRERGERERERERRKRERERGSRGRKLLLDISHYNVIQSSISSLQLQRTPLQLPHITDKLRSRDLLFVVAAKNSENAILPLLFKTTANGVHLVCSNGVPKLIVVDGGATERFS